MRRRYRALRRLRGARRVAACSTELFAAAVVSSDRLDLAILGCEADALNVMVEERAGARGRATVASTVVALRALGLATDVRGELRLQWTLIDCAAGL